MESGCLFAKSLENIAFVMDKCRMNANWVKSVERAVEDQGIESKVVHIRANVYRLNASIEKNDAKRLEMSILNKLCDDNWHQSVVVVPRQSQIRFVFYGRLSDFNFE